MNKLLAYCVLIVFSMLFINGCSSVNMSEKEPENVLIFDSPAYSKISTKALVEKLGKPKSKEDWSNETPNGTFKMKIYSYDLDGMSCFG